MSPVGVSNAMGWLPDYPDHRDFHPDHETIKPMVGGAGLLTSKKKSAAPQKVDLSNWCSPIEDQEDIGSCTAHAGVGVLEYFERRAFGKHIDASRLFLYRGDMDNSTWFDNVPDALREMAKLLE